MIILEGTDAVGKTSVINNLKEYDIKDRDKNICSLIDFNISLKDRAKRLKEYLDSFLSNEITGENFTGRVISMLSKHSACVGKINVESIINVYGNDNVINNDKSELERRINLRDVIDEYDRYTYLYNILYLETYIYMEQHNLLNNKLYMVDCTGLNVEEETEAVKKMIDYAKYNSTHGNS